MWLVKVTLFQVMHYWATRLYKAVKSLSSKKPLRGSKGISWDITRSPEPHHLPHLSSFSTYTSIVINSPKHYLESVLLQPKKKKMLGKNTESPGYLTHLHALLYSIHRTPSVLWYDKYCILIMQTSACAITLMWLLCLTWRSLQVGLTEIVFSCHHGLDRRSYKHAQRSLQIH